MKIKITHPVKDEDAHYQAGEIITCSESFGQYCIEHEFGFEYADTGTTLDLKSKRKKRKEVENDDW